MTINVHLIADKTYPKGIDLKFESKSAVNFPKWRLNPNEELTVELKLDNIENAQALDLLAANNNSNRSGLPLGDQIKLIITLATGEKYEFYNDISNRTLISDTHCKFSFRDMVGM